MCACIQIEKEELNRLYWKLNQSCSEIAHELGCSSATVRNRMEKYDLPLRSDSASLYALSLRSKWWAKSRYDLGYVVGAILGDGTVSTSTDHSKIVQLSVTSKDFRDSVAAALQRLGFHVGADTINPPSSTSKNETYRLRTSSLSFHQFLKRIKARRLIALLSTREVARGFIRGFYEAEGSLHVLYCRQGYAERRLSISNTKLWLIDIVAWKLTSNFGVKFWRSKGRYPKRGIYYPQYHLYITKQKDIDHFLREFKPCIRNSVDPSRMVRRVTIAN